MDFRDFVRGNFKDFNIVDYIGVGQCKKVESASENTWECIKQHSSGSKMGHGACTSIVRMLAVNSIHLLARLGAKIILVFTGLPTRNSAAARMISQQHSGGLEVICEEHNLSH